MNLQGIKKPGRIKILRMKKLLQISQIKNLISNKCKNTKNIYHDKVDLKRFLPITSSTSSPTSTNIESAKGTFIIEAKVDKIDVKNNIIFYSKVS